MKINKILGILLILISCLMITTNVMAESIFENIKYAEDSNLNQNLIALTYDGEAYQGISGNDNNVCFTEDPTQGWISYVSGLEYELFSGYYVPEPITDIATDGNTWVIVGEQGGIATSSEAGATWTQNTEDPFLGTKINKVTTDGDMWVAVSDGGEIATATDPAGTWTLNTDDPFSGDAIYDITIDGDTWIIVGFDRKVAYTTDPTSIWTLTTGSITGVGTNLYSIAVHDGVWVVAGLRDDRLRVNVSDSDGDAWTYVADVEFISGGSFIKPVVETDGVNWTVFWTDGGVNALSTTTTPDIELSWEVVDNSSFTDISEWITINYFEDWLITYKNNVYTPNRSPNMEYMVWDEEVGLGYMDYAMGMHISTDGDYLYDTNEGAIYQYELGTAWDATTASYMTFNNNPLPETTDLYFKPDGTMLWTVSDFGFIAQSYASVAWDINTLDGGTTEIIDLDPAIPKGITFSDDGNKAIVIQTVAGNNQIVQYNLSTPWDLTTKDGGVSMGAIYNSESPVDIVANDTGTYIYEVYENGQMYEWYFGTPWDITGTTEETGRIIYTNGPYNYGLQGVYLNPNEDRYYKTGRINGIITQNILPKDWNVSYYDTDYNNIMEFPDLGGGESDIKMSPDGEDLFFIQNSDLYHYELIGDPFDISQRVFVEAITDTWTNYYDYGVPHPFYIRGGVFTSDGSKLIARCSDDLGNNEFMEFELSSPWDLSTLQATGNTKLDLSYGSPEGKLSIKPDGTQIYVQQLEHIYIYDLNVGWDVSTIEYKGQVTIPGNQSRGVDISSKGDKLYSLADFAVIEWDIEVPWDMTTLTLSTNDEFVHALPDFGYFDVGGGLYVHPNNEFMFAYIGDNMGMNPPTGIQYTAVTPEDPEDTDVNKLEVPTEYPLYAGNSYDWNLTYADPGYDPEYDYIATLFLCPEPDSDPSACEILTDGDILAITDTYQSFIISGTVDSTMIGDDWVSLAQINRYTPTPPDDTVTFVEADANVNVSSPYTTTFISLPEYDVNKTYYDLYHDYTWSFGFADSSFAGTKTYSYNFGSNDTNAINGNEEIYIETEEFTMVEGASANIDFNNMFDYYDVATDQYFYIEVVIYDSSDSSVVQEIVWTDEVYDIGFVRSINFDNWETNPTSFGDSVTALATDGNLWVAGLGNGNIATTYIPNSSWNIIDGYHPGYSISDIATDGDSWLGVGYYGSLGYATDPTSTWAELSPFTTRTLNGVASNGSKWVAVGNNSTLEYTTDYTSGWTEGYPGASANYHSIGYHNGLWLLTYQGGAAYSSTAHSWTTTNSGFGAYGVNGQDASDGTWVIVGQEGKISTNTDITTNWTTCNSDTTTTLNDVATDGNYWVAIGALGVITTTEEPTNDWTNRTGALGSGTNYEIETDEEIWVIGGSGIKTTSYTRPQELELTSVPEYGVGEEYYKMNNEYEWAVSYKDYLYHDTKEYTYTLGSNNKRILDGSEKEYIVNGNLNAIPGYFTDTNIAYDFNYEDLADNQYFYVTTNVYDPIAETNTQEIVWTDEVYDINKSSVINFISYPETGDIYNINKDYTWDLSYTDEDYISEWYYKYSFGSNDTNTFDGSEEYYYNNVDFSSELIGGDWTTTVSNSFEKEDIGDKYFFMKVNVYDETLDLQYTDLVWGTTEYEVLWNKDVELTSNPEPDNKYNINKEYDWELSYTDDSYLSEWSYRYSFGSNDTNTFDGSEEYYYNNIDFSSEIIDGDWTTTVSNSFDEEEVGNKYFFMKVNVYDDLNHLKETISLWTVTDYEIEWTNSLTFESNSEVGNLYYVDNEYTWNVTYSDDSYNEDWKYKYTLGYSNSESEGDIVGFYFPEIDFTDSITDGNWAEDITYEFETSNIGVYYLVLEINVYDSTNTLIDTFRRFSTSPFDITEWSEHIIELPSNINGGLLYGWGNSSTGQLGSISSSTTPIKIGYFNNWWKVDSSFNNEYTMGIKHTYLYGWGDNNYGQLGDGTLVAKDTPIQIGTNDGWIDVAVGAKHTIGINNGELYVWGNNDYGQLGDGTLVAKNTPTKISSVNWTKVKAKGYSNLGLSNGRLYAWGDNNYGQLGDGTSVAKDTPTQIGTDSDWTDIAMGGSHALGINNGELYAWGNNDYGQLGDGTSVAKNTPTQIGIDSDWNSVCNGYSYSIGIKNNGELYAWGDNNYGQLGDGTSIDKDIPTQIGADDDWVSASCGLDYVIAKKGAEFYSWGHNDYGQLGDGTTTDRESPVLVNTSYDWIDLFAGDNVSYGLVKQKTLSNPTSEMDFLPANVNYNWTLLYADTDYNAEEGGYYYYNFGINDVNVLDGNEMTLKMLENIDINSEFANYNIDYYLTSAYAGEWYAFVNIYKNEVLYETIWSEDTFSTQKRKLLLKFFDEELETKLDEYVVINDLTNDVTYSADENGEFKQDLSDINWDNQYTDIVVSRIEDDLVTHEARNIQFYWQDLGDNNLLDMNVQLLANDVGENIEFKIIGENDEDWSNKFMMFRKANGDLIEVKKIDTDSKNTYYVLPDGNYIAYLYDGVGNLEYTYNKTTVNMSKPIDEMTGNDVSPYDITVGGLLAYELTDLTAETTSFNIFSGTVGYYNFKVVDYNAVDADRKYLPRTYIVNSPLGSGFNDTYNLQPYLINKTDPVFLNVTVKNTLGNNIPNTQLLMYKFIDGYKQIVSSKTTDMLGKVTFSLYPEDEYYLYVYYDDVLKLGGENTIRITEDQDITITLDLTVDEDIEQLWTPTINWKESKGMYNLNDSNISIEAEINSNYNMESYTIELYNGTNIVYEDSIEVSSNKYILDYTIDSNVIEDPFLSGEVRITVVNELNPNATKTFKRLIAFTDRKMTPMDAFTKAGQEFGQPLSMIIAIMLVGILIAFAIFSAGIVDSRIITGLGLLGLAIFMFFGWLNSGVTVFGTDISVFIFAMVCIAYVLSLVRGVR